MIVRLLLAAVLVALPPAAVRSQTPATDSYEKFGDVMYSERKREDGAEELLCDVYVPIGDGPFPAVLCVHGGAWRLGRKEHMAHVAKKLAARGYVTVAINYRLAPKYKFPAQQQDCRDAIRWTKDHAAKYRIDPQCIAALGYSAGAQMVTLAALEGTSADRQESANDSARDDTIELKAVVAGGTPCDFRNLPAGSRGLAYWLGGTRGEFPERYAAASPASFVSAAAPPMFFFHGERDALVPLAGVQALAEKLQQAGAVSQLYLVPDSGHITAYFNDEAYDRAIDFLDEHVKTADHRS